MHQSTTHPGPTARTHHVQVYLLPIIHHCFRSFHVLLFIIGCYITTAYY